MMKGSNTKVPTKVPIKTFCIRGNFARCHILYGSPGRARTADLMINSHPLYRLSYRGMRRNLKTIPVDGQVYLIFFLIAKDFEPIQSVF